jgi:imidazole glycerol phosphate synthase glutamine amidotransferase subunit
MQLLCRGSEESPGADGLEVIDITVSRFGGEEKVPQLGWNQVEPGPGSRFVEPGWAYFANSYRLDLAPEGWVGSDTEYGGRFVSALERGDVLACQFHPELSGAWGARLLGRWLEMTRAAA